MEGGLAAARARNDTLRATRHYGRACQPLVDLMDRQGGQARLAKGHGQQSSPGGATPMRASILGACLMACATVRISSELAGKTGFCRQDNSVQDG